MSRITNSSVDWLTMTSREDEVGGDWWQHYKEYRASVEKEEPAERPFHNGFYAGMRVGKLLWGYSEVLGYMLVASGEQANKSWLHYQPARHRVTRIDLALDFHLDLPRNLAKIHYDTRMMDKERMLPKLTLWNNSFGGSTLYVGSRQSQQYGRLYDKGNQTGTQENNVWWRAEVEYKKPIADLVSQELYTEEPDQRLGVIADTVADWYADRDISLPVRPIGGGAIVAQAQQRITTFDRKLAWLRAGVAPTVAALVEAGLGRDVMTALLLDEREVRSIWNDEK